MITADGCWAAYRVDSAATRGKPCLFLDRDGVLIEDTGYPHDPATVILIEETLNLVRAAAASGFVVGIVSNQSGVGRGYFDWSAFAAVQGVIDDALAIRGTKLDFVLACPHLPETSLAHYRHDAHPWRKPLPGMILAAGAVLSLDLAHSAMVGDRWSDMDAARSAGLAHRALLTEDRSVECASASARVPRAALLEWFHAAVPTMRG